MPVSDVSTFLKLLAQSGLLAEEQMSSIRSKAESLSDPKDVARQLLREGALTKWQALQLLAGRSALKLGPYHLREQLEGEGSELTFAAIKPGTEEEVVLKSLPRKQAAVSPDAVESFFQRVVKSAEEAGVPVLDKHPAEGDNDRAYIVIGKAATAAPAVSSSDSTEAPAPKKAAAPPPRKTAARRDSKPLSNSDSSVVKVGKPKAKSGPLPKTKSGPLPKTGAGANSVAVDTGGKPGGNAPASPADSGTAGFTISTKRRKKPGKGAGKSKRPAREEKPAEPEKAAAAASVSDEGAGSERRGIPKMAWVIGGSVVGGLVLVTVVVGALIMMSSDGESTDVAQADTENGSESSATDDGNSSSGDASSNDGDTPADLETDVETEVSVPVLPISGSSTPDATEPSVAPDSDTDAAGTDTDPSPDASGGAAGTVTEPPGMDTPDDTGAETQEPEPNPADGAGGSSSTTGQPAAKPETDPMPPVADNTPKIAEKKEPKPPVKKAPPKPDKKPFEDLPPVASLPPHDGAEGQTPKKLGSLYIPEDELCFAKLRGGDVAFNGSQQFAMRNADGGVAERDWEILLRSGDAGAETKIAHLTVDDQAQLLFRWEPGAETEPACQFLSNCPLSFSCGGESGVLMLRRATQVEAMPLNLEKSAIRENWTLELPPNPDAIRVEILGLEGAKSTVEPVSVVAVENGEAWVRVQDGGGVLSLKVETDFRRKLEISVTPSVQFPGTEPQKLNRRQLQQGLQRLTQEEAFWTQTVEQLRQALNGLDRQKANAVKIQVAQAEQELASRQQISERIVKLEEMLTKMGEGFRLKMRIYSEAGASQVELLKIGT